MFSFHAVKLFTRFMDFSCYEVSQFTFKYNLVYVKHHDHQAASCALQGKRNGPAESRPVGTEFG